MQDTFPAAGVPEDRGRGFGLAERTEPRLRDHVPDALHPAEVHDTL